MHAIGFRSDAAGRLKRDRAAAGKGVGHLGASAETHDAKLLDKLFDRTCVGSEMLVYLQPGATKQAVIAVLGASAEVESVVVGEGLDPLDKPSASLVAIHIAPPARLSGSWISFDNVLVPVPLRVDILGGGSCETRFKRSVRHAHELQEDREVALRIVGRGKQGPENGRPHDDQPVSDLSNTNR